MKADSTLLNLIADNLNNLSSGWFAVVIGTLILSPGPTPDFLNLTIQFLTGIVSLLTAYLIKKNAAKYS